MPSNLPKQIEKSVANFASVVESRVDSWKAVRDPAAFRAMELEVAAEARVVADEITGHVLRAILRDPELQAEASVAARRAYPGRHRHGGRRTVKVTLLGGEESMGSTGQRLDPRPLWVAADSVLSWGSTSTS